MGPGLGQGLGEGVGAKLGVGRGEREGAAVGVGRCVGKGMGVGVGTIVGVGTCVGVGIGVGEGMGEGDGTGVGVTTGVGGGVGRGIGVGPACASSPARRIPAITASTTGTFMEVFIGTVPHTGDPPLRIKVGAERGGRGSGVRGGILPGPPATFQLLLPGPRPLVPSAWSPASAP